MLSLNESNYFSTEAGKDYWSVSSFKAFAKCEAAGLAQIRGEYKREETDALLIGSYVDAYFTGDFEKYRAEHEDEMFTKKGTLYAKYETADKCIEAVENQPLMMDYLKGEKQVIMAAELFDVPWKIKIDVHHGDRIVDLKTVKDFADIYEVGFGYRSWIEAWGYDIQGAVYQRIEQIYSGRTDPLPFYLVAVTKEKVPDVAVIQIPQHVLDTALKVVEAKIDRFDLVKHGMIPAERCERCLYCKETKRLTEPMIYEREE